ncbi:uncharacterized protein LOC133723037 [Rosa rugosa]|uniref:uncharacterized protein LOC133723037 n=1 Tax=Rosa rugosa TaxID=74645 RepID=UPI002B4030EC|nr:uncharacterized protein LOC133723037 [Rosa rugosa]
MEAQKMYPRSNSDSDVTLSSSAFKAEEPTSKIVKSSGDLCRGEDGADTGEIYEDNNSKESSMCSVEMDVSCQNGLCTRAPDSCNSMQGSYEENGISDPIVNSTSNSDNCSSCLSEGDSNTTSSNHGNQESSSTSDSEDASQQSGGKETSVCIPNGFTECNEVGIENNPNVKRRELTESRELTGLPPNGGTNPLTNVQSFDNGISAASLGSQQQSMLPTMQNQNVHFPVFQAPSTMGYYHQSPVSWPPAPTNGLLPFTHPNHYLYASPLGYGINGNSGFCMQYSPMQQLPTPLFTPTAVPMYQPLINTEEQSQISKSGVQESPNEANTESLDGTGHHSMQAASSGEGAHDDNSGKLHMDNGGFSLFHFGGPVALSSGCNSNSMPSQEEIVRDFPIKCSDHIENV